ncbi:MAG: glutamate-1-semialdehyde-2,1-aminomutase [Gammaproteobacteria bacterium]|nr:glutamate-1-semialdehyde-2,1-aminomutase [Gammaproteobacteria bacterium]
MHQSSHLFQEALQVIPGGVNSPVRAFKGVGGDPIFFKQGKGAYLVDVDNHHYIDYVGSWGPLIVGHAHPEVLKRVQETMAMGMTFGAPTEIEIQMAKKISQLMPSIEKVRMVNSGTEATMTAIRLARAVTGRQKIIKFSGCYHGHSDALLVKAGSGLLTLGVPSTPGVPEHLAQNTLTVPYNDLESLQLLFQTYGNDIAGIIIEPIAGNMGMVKPEPGYLAGIRKLCDEYQSIFILDEVMTGFRVALGGAQSIERVVPDLTTLGKIIGGGMPVGAIGGKSWIMDNLAPVGPVYQAGTLSGNPMAMSAGLATLEMIEAPGFYDKLSQMTDLLMSGMKEIAEHYHIPLQTCYEGGMFGFCFTAQHPIRRYEDIATGDEGLFKRFFHRMLKNGVYLAPSMYEAGFISGAHTREDIENTLKAVDQAFCDEQKV